jgi:colanic acid/amylovoran biosynthesis glycosyltransferase
MRIAYFFTDLPDGSGTFPVAEVEAMADHGLEIEIFCLRSRLVAGSAARRLLSRFPVHQAGYFAPRVLAATGWMLLSHPRTCVRTLCRAVLDTGSHPRILLKTLGIFPKCCLFAREAQSGRFDLLWAFWASLPGRAAWWISALTGIPYGTWAHAGNDIYNRRHQTESALATILGGAQLVCTCNRTNLEYFRTVLPADLLGRIHYHPHGIDLNRFRARETGTTSSGGAPVTPVGSASERAAAAPGEDTSPRDGCSVAVRILSVGRLGEAKGFQFGVEAIARLRDRGISARYRVVGEGPLRAALAARARELGIAEAIELPGAVDQGHLPDEYRAADIFLMPSIVGRLGARDGLPNVLLEAMACGVPCIGSDTVGIPEVIVHGKTGLLVRPADPDGIADAVTALTDDADGRQRMARAGQQLVRESFAREACMTRLAEIFRGTLGADGAGIGGLPDSPTRVPPGGPGRR